MKIGPIHLPSQAGSRLKWVAREAFEVGMEAETLMPEFPFASEVDAPTID